MSLVGPRPEVPEFVTLFEMRFRFLLTVRPGITDPASIQFRNEESVLLGSKENPQREYVERVLPAKLELARKLCKDAFDRGRLPHPDPNDRQSPPDDVVTLMVCSIAFQIFGNRGSVAVRSRLLLDVPHNSCWCTYLC